jgi:hypothetical protein
VTCCSVMAGRLDVCPRMHTVPDYPRMSAPSLFALFTMCSATNFIPSCKMELQRKLFYPAWLPSLSCVMRQQQTLLAHWVTKHNAYFLIKCVSLPWQNFYWRKLTGKCRTTLRWDGKNSRFHVDLFKTWRLATEFEMRIGSTSAWPNFVCDFHDPT